MKHFSTVQALEQMSGSVAEEELGVPEGTTHQESGSAIVVS